MRQIILHVLAGCLLIPGGALAQSATCRQQAAAQHLSAVAMQGFFVNCQHTVQVHCMQQAMAKQLQGADRMKYVRACMARAVG